MEENYYKFYYDTLKEINRMRSVEKERDNNNHNDDSESCYSIGREEAMNEILMFMYEKIVFGNAGDVNE